MYNILHKHIYSILESICGYEHSNGAHSIHTFHEYKLIGIKTYIDFDEEHVQWKIKYGNRELYKNIYGFKQDMLEKSYDILLDSIRHVFDRCSYQFCIYCNFHFLSPDYSNICILCNSHEQVEFKDELVNDSICVICLSPFESVFTKFQCKTHFVHIGCKSNYIRENKNKTYKCPLRCS